MFSAAFGPRSGVDAPPDGGDVADVAAAIALDVLTLLRGDGGLAATAEAA